MRFVNRLADGTRGDGVSDDVELVDAVLEVRNQSLAALALAAEHEQVEWERIRQCGGWLLGS